MGERIEVPLRNLFVWYDNPRAALEKVGSEEEAIDILFEVEGKGKMLALASDIAEFGLNSHRLPIVVWDGDLDAYVVYDGNRRICVLKLLANKDKRVAGIKNHIGVSLDTKIYVYVTNREEALRLIENEHSGEQGGKGQISWDSYQRDYARYKMGKEPKYPIAFQVSQICNLLSKKDFKKIPYTDLETLFNNAAVKKIFNVKGDWDFSNSEFIRNVYSKLVKNKPRSPYSRYLVKLNKSNDEYERFKGKLLADDDIFPLQDKVKQPVDEIKPLGIVSRVNIDSPVKDLEPIIDEKQSMDLISSVDTQVPVEVKSIKKNSYTTTPVELLSYAKNNINIDSNVFKKYLEFVVKSRFHSNHPYKIIIPYLFRVLLESAIHYWIEWLKDPENQNKFRMNSDGVIGDVYIINLLNTPRETSVVNVKKLNEIKTILKMIKDNNSNKYIKSCFSGIPKTRTESFVNDINSVVHGSIIEIDSEKLKNYDEFVLSYLKAMSRSMEKN